MIAMNKHFIHICVMCGEDFENNIQASYKCPKCEEKLMLIKKLEMIDKAERKLTMISGRNRMRKNIDLSLEIKTVRNKVISGKNKFSSLPEAIVAIQLEHQKINYETQKEIGGKRVDFYLPDLKIILEIDGELYHKDEDELFLRDRKIMRIIGEKWEIIHINSDYVPRYTWNLKEALPFIISERNEQQIFRDSRLDDYFLEKFRNMELYLKSGGTHDN